MRLFLIWRGETPWARLLWFLTFVWVFVGASSLLYAQGKVDYTLEVSQKLGRGVINVISSPAEIPCTMSKEIKDRGGIGSVTGFFRGIVFMLRRVLVGSTEIMSFVIPMKETLPPVCAQPPPAQVQV